MGIEWDFLEESIPFTCHIEICEQGKLTSLRICKGCFGFRLDTQATFLVKLEI